MALHYIALQTYVIRMFYKPYTHAYESQIQDSLQLFTAKKNNRSPQKQLPWGPGPWKNEWSFRITSSLKTLTQISSGCPNTKLRQNRLSILRVLARLRQFFGTQKRLPSLLAVSRPFQRRIFSTGIVIVPTSEHLLWAWAGVGMDAEPNSTRRIHKCNLSPT